MVRVCGQWGLTHLSVLLVQHVLCFLLVSVSLVPLQVGSLVLVFGEPHALTSGVRMGPSDVLFRHLSLHSSDG